MKISKREKIMILCLLILAALYLIYTFGIKALESYKQEVYKKHGEVLLIYNKTVDAISNISLYEKKLSDSQSRVRKLSEGYLNKIEQEKIILYLEGFFAKNNIKVTSVTFTDISSHADEKANQETEGENILSPVQRADILLSYEAGYIDLLRFMDDIRNNPINVSIKSISSSSVRENKLAGSMTLDIYASDNAYTKENAVKWEKLINYGKANPFMAQGSFIEAAGLKDSNYDFNMVVSPISSDLPTVVLLKNDDADSSYVQADSSLAENVNLSFKNEDGKYYYKQSTNYMRYPVDGDWKEFSPNGKNYIGLKIYSSKRTSDADTSGAMLIVDNQSGLEIQVKIVDDDSVRPRINFESMEGVRISYD